MEPSATEQIQNILDVIISYARLDFKKQVRISKKGDELDALGAGVNMLGEELNASVLSLREKENMLREIHHRVKNNLQIISSLLNLQIQKERSEKIKLYAKESQSRIRTMSLIHEMLYHSVDFKNTNFREYVLRLTEMLDSTYQLPNQNIRFSVKIPDELTFDIDHLIPLGLILNESISNSLKYAFPTGEGEIRVILTHTSKVQKLIVSDNGIGLKKDFDLNRDANLGIQLIHILAEQVNMSLVMKNQIGVQYELTF